MTLKEVLARRLAAPLRWTGGDGRPLRSRPEQVTITIPVFGAAEDLGRCLVSVGAHTDLERHRVLLVLDGPQDEAVEARAATFAAAHPRAVRILRNETRRGFVVSANRGMAESSGDIVLLNSDTVVTPRWLEKMIDAAVSNGDVATVTPLSNHATLCSVPRGFVENLLPSGHDAVSFAALIERVSMREYPRLPTGVGFCLYIAREAFEEIGPFDEEAFGVGYGEENDFCLRALKRGWIHIADDATFVLHAGQRSFRESRALHQRRGSAALATRHPEYVPTIAAFMEADPLATVRERISAALRTPKTASRAPKRVVHVLHGWPPFQRAGVELYASWLVQRQLRWRDVAVYARLDDPARKQGEAVELDDAGARVRLVTNNFTQRDPFARNAMRDRVLQRDFQRFVDDVRPDLLHIHHLAGHAFSLANVRLPRGVPIVQQLHDWWALCARVNLCDAQWRRCSGPSIAKCSRCAPLTGIAPTLWNPLLHRARIHAARRALRTGSVFVMGSEAIRDDFARAGFLPAGRPVFVRPYGIDLAGDGRPRSPVVRPLRFGFIGSVLPHKGLHIAIEAFRDFARHEANLRIWGSVSIDPAYTARLRELAGAAAVSFETPFAEEEKGALLASIDVLLMPSVGLESFGIAAREAMASGVPVIATNDGALGELRGPGVLHFPNGDVAALRAILRRLIDDPSLVDAMSHALGPQKNMDEHAEEIEAIYAAAMDVRR